MNEKSTKFGSVLCCFMHHKIINIQLEMTWLIASITFKFNLYVMMYAYNTRKAHKCKHTFTSTEIQNWKHSPINTVNKNKLLTITKSTRNRVIKIVNSYIKTRSFEKIVKQIRRYKFFLTILNNLNNFSKNIIKYNSHETKNVIEKKKYLRIHTFSRIYI